MDVPLKAKLASAGYRPDPVTTEIVRNGLIAATEEMKTNLMRTAYNMIIYEALDFTVGLFDAEGDTLSIGLGLPMFIRGMSDTVKTKLQHYGVENLDPGDILLTNDAYITGSHLNHMTFTVPIFHDGEVVAFSCCMAHWPDVGGTLDGATTDIFSEGLQMPIVKIYRRGVPNEELISIIRTNVRLPDRAMGDFRAQVAAVKTGERRFLEMIRNTAATPCSAASKRSWTTARPRRARGCGRSPTASTRPSPSWTTTASGSASGCRFACASKSPASG
jgi:N-methylhydantoinase B